MSFDPGISVDTTVRDSYFGFYSSKDKDDSGDRDDSRTSSDDQAETGHNLVETSQKRGLHRGFSSESWQLLARDVPNKTPFRKAVLILMSRYLITR